MDEKDILSTYITQRCYTECALVKSGTWRLHQAIQVRHNISTTDYTELKRGEKLKSNFCIVEENDNSNADSTIATGYSIETAWGHKLAINTI